MVTSAGVPGLLFLVVFGIIVYGTMLLVVSRGSITQAGKVLLASRLS
jgi:hypothetical protein